jgi:hypothetical protein
MDPDMDPGLDPAPGLSVNNKKKENLNFNGFVTFSSHVNIPTESNKQKS